MDDFEDLVDDTSFKEMKKQNIYQYEKDTNEENLNKKSNENNNKNIFPHSNEVINMINTKITPDIVNNEKETKEQLIKELLEKEILLNQLIKSNDELKLKIEFSTKKFEEIEAKVKIQEKDKLAINKQIKKIENEIKGYKTENDKYIKQIEYMKNKLALKDKIEKESNIKLLLQTEQDKNKELKNKLTNIKNINLAQKKYINHYEKKNKIKGKITELKSEIENEKDSLKTYQERYNKIDNFNTMMTNEIQKIKIKIQKLEDKKEEVKKIFTKDELDDTLGILKNLRNIINQKRNDLDNICKNNEEKLFKILSKNKIVQSEINENIRMNKLLICKRNELKRFIKTNLYHKK